MLKESLLVKTKCQAPTNSQWSLSLKLKFSKEEIVECCEKDCEMPKKQPIPEGSHLLELKCSEDGRGIGACGKGSHGGSESVTAVKNEKDVERLSDAWSLCEDSDHVGCKFHRGVHVFGHSISPYMLKYRGRVVGSRTEELNICMIPVTSDYIKDDDCLSLNCTVGVVGSRTEELNICMIPVIESNLGEDFGEFMDSGKGADVTFEVDEKIFQADKLVYVSRSPVLNAQLPVFKAMLHFIYQDVLPDMLELTGSNSPMASTSMP
ncbi:hypothetical protein SUGI_0653270 [Cryptomeria japonica]|nr:hypothetical protein SUGI_0653170 [Cryptomeria japonica]GLJ32467.1 hypothetical protein SUGI_0653190 [Cryptomeria japonica]GLJ32468.1 hypothetical protein SUGI_0653210 [Cryptomeria japonica]GLJ32469.1 hypothetical protein SUGI_0653230 [Cryptomeria japonica]GLJ32470.1 hypothetical protein SUGI_0653250 [Cryptomeria japonica]